MHGSWSRQPIGRFVAAACCAVATLVAAHDKGPYSVSDHARLGFTLTSNAYDAVNNRLYASARDGVYEVDTSAGKVLGQIGRVSGAGSVAFSAKQKELYLLSLHEDVMRVIDIDSRKVVRTFDAPAWFNVFYDASRDELYYLRADTKAVRVASRVDGHTIATLTLDGHPSFVLMDPARKRILIRLADRDLIQVLDATEHAIAVSWPLTADGQSAMAVDDTGTRVFVSSGKNLKVLDGQSGKEMSRISIGDQVRSIVYDPATQLVGALWSQSQIRVAHLGPLGLDAAQNLDTRAVVRQLFLDPATHAILAVATLAEPDKMGVNANFAPDAGLRTSALLTLKYSR